MGRPRPYNKACGKLAPTARQMKLNFSKITLQLPTRKRL